MCLVYALSCIIGIKNAISVFYSNFYCLFFDTRAHTRTYTYTHVYTHNTHCITTHNFYTQKRNLKFINKFNK